MERSILPAAWKIPDPLRKRLGNRVGRQRVMLEDGHLLMVVHLPPKPDDVQRQGRFFWRAPDGQWSSSDLGGGLAAVQKHLEAYAEAIGTIDRAEEQAQQSNDYFQVINQLAPVLRACRHLHQVLQDARKLLPGAREIIDLRDQAYELERTAELLFQDAKNSLDFLVARRAEEQAGTSRRMEEAAYRLNMLVAFFFPLATLFAFFGMNVHSTMQEMRQTPGVFAGFLIAGLLGGFLLKAVVGGKPTPPSASKQQAEIKTDRVK